MDRVRSPVVWAGILLAIASFFVYWLSNRAFDAGRGDLFYLADAFLHGRVWLDFVPGPFDIISVRRPRLRAVRPVPGDRPDAAGGAPWAPSPPTSGRPGINAFLASMVVLLAWWVSGRIGATKLRDRFAMAVLLGFSTQIWWVTTRGGVWHTGHLIATILTLLLLAEMFGRKRAFLMGLLVGAAFLTRAPVAFAAPAVALWLIPSDAIDGLRHGSIGSRIAALPWRRWVFLGLGLLPALAFFFWYNVARFGDPLESGYAMATLPGVAPGPARPGPVLDRAHPDEPRVPVLEDARADGGVPVLPTRRPRHVRAHHQPGAAARRPRPVARSPVVDPAVRRGRWC